VATVKAMVESMIPPTINTKNVDEALPEGIDLTLGKAVKKEMIYAMSNTFGFGGHNAIALFKKV
ncbi:MAG: beta-ketoacyl-[acyl-carrier-protein] synthase II, partial [Fulvivirga sp.]